MDKLMKTSQVAQKLLECDEETRKDDLYLYEQILNSKVPGLGDVARIIHNYMRAGTVSKWEGMGRARRKIQAKHPELKDKKTAQYRKLEEEKYKEFARC